MDENRSFTKLEVQPLARILTRRRFMHVFGVGAAATTLTLLAACAADDDEVDAVEPDEDVTPDDDEDDEPLPDDDDEPADDTDDSAESPTDPDAEKRISVIWSSPLTMNPVLTSSGNDEQVARLLFGSLVKMSDVLEPTPDLAETVETSEDAGTYTFRLHEDLQFSDGEPLTSEDVAFTFERALNPDTGGWWRGKLIGILGAPDVSGAELVGVEGVQTPDDRTIEITLAEPDAAFLVNLSNFSGLGILPKHVLEEVPPEQIQEHSFTLQPNVSGGAYRFVRYETDQFLEIERNPNYGLGEPAIDRMFLNIVTPEVGLAQLETQELDVTTVPIPEVERTSQIPHVVVESTPSPSMTFVIVNFNRDFLDNKDLRKAMMHAIDRHGILEQVLSGEGEVVNSSIFGPEWIGEPEGLDQYEYDPDRAREYLEASQWDGTHRVEITYNPGNQVDDAAIAIVLQQWREIGFEVEMSQVDGPELSRRYGESDFDLLWLGGGVFRADPDVSAGYLTSWAWGVTPDGDAIAPYIDPQVDELFTAGKSAGNIEERLAIYTELAQILNDDLPFLPLWSPNSVFGVNQRVQGFRPPSYIHNFLWNAEEWDVTD